MGGRPDLDVRAGAYALGGNMLTLDLRDNVGTAWDTAVPHVLSALRAAAALSQTIAVSEL